MIYLYDITVEENEHLYGPGRRIVIWTKGCTIGCFGCTSKHLWTRENAKLYTTQELIDYCINQDNIEGITLHGGEPTDQMESLMPVIKALKKHGFSVILFTGHEIEEFKSSLELEFISLCDLIKCGPFDITKVNRFLQFRGSTNQRLIKITKRYENYELKDGLNVVLLEFDKSGILINKGFPDKDMEQLIDELSVRNEINNDCKRQTKRNKC